MTHKKSTRKTHSGARNVYWDSKREQYYVRVTKDGLLYTGGHYFDEDELEAAKECASELRRKLKLPDIEQPFARQ